MRNLCWSGERVAGSEDWEAMVTFREKVNTVEWSNNIIFLLYKPTHYNVF